jgi:hypothetical protein
MSKERIVVISDDRQTVYLVDEYKEILAQMSMNWFFIVNPHRKEEPTSQELKSVLLRFYQDMSGFNYKNLKKMKRKVKGNVDKS